VSFSLDTHGEIAQIHARLEAIEHMQEVLVRAEFEKIEKQIWERMDQDDTLAWVFLLVDGRRSQGDIARSMTSLGAKGASEATVSRKLEILFKDLYLIERGERQGNSNIYKRSTVDRVLGIKRKLEKRRAVTADQD
jgi:DNA-binding transcriptional ArsR family regulator